jgi:bla regulator protein BlaR1
MLMTMFEQVWVLSLEASGLILLIILTRIAFKRWLSPIWIYALWLILLLKLSIPWTYDSDVNMYKVIPEIMEKAVVVSEVSMNPQQIDDVEPISLEQKTQSIKPALLEFNILNHFSHTLSTILFYIWIFGVIILLLRGIFQQYRFHRLLKADAALTQDASVIEQLRNCLAELKLNPYSVRIRKRLAMRPYCLESLPRSCSMELRLSV